MSDLKQLAMVQTQSKSLAAGLFLALFFGGFGMLYAGLIWGLIGICVELILWLIFVLTAGLGFFLIVPWHILAALITMASVNMHNKRLLARL